MSFKMNMDNYFYSKFSKNWDDKIFRNEILKKIHKNSIILDLGAGAGIVEAMDMKGLGEKVCGVDLDERVVNNPFLDEGKIADASGIPYSNDTFDVVFSDNVLEHLENPRDVFSEVNRVLKPGGVYLFKTPNKWHYIPLISRITPHWFHEYVNKLRGRNEDDTFPTVYKANSTRDIKEICKQTGFDIEYLKLIEGRPEYLRMFWVTYIPGLLYERIVNFSNIFSGIRILIIGSVIKR